MGKIVAYLRASTDKQDLSHQKLELLEFARNKSLKIGNCSPLLATACPTGVSQGGSNHQ